MIDWTRPNRIFPHHLPTPEQIDLIGQLRREFEELAWNLRDMVPPGEDRAAAERALHAAQQAYIFALIAPAPQVDPFATVPRDVAPYPPTTSTASLLKDSQEAGQ